MAGVATRRGVPLAGAALAMRCGAAAVTRAPWLGRRNHIVGLGSTAPLAAGAWLGGLLPLLVLVGSLPRQRRSAGFSRPLD